MFEKQYKKIPKKIKTSINGLMILRFFEKSTSAAVVNEPKLRVSAKP